MHVRYEPVLAPESLQKKMEEVLNNRCFGNTSVFFLYQQCAARHLFCGWRQRRIPLV